MATHPITARQHTENRTDRQARPARNFAWVSVIPCRMKVEHSDACSTPPLRVESGSQLSARKVSAKPFAGLGHHNEVSGLHTSGVTRGAMPDSRAGSPFPARCNWLVVSGFNRSQACTLPALRGVVIFCGQGVLSPDARGEI